MAREAAAGHTRLRIGYAWSAMGRHTVAFQRRWATEHPDTELQLIRTNSGTAGLAEGACDVAVIGAAPFGVDTPADLERARAILAGARRRAQC